MRYLIDIIGALNKAEQRKIERIIESQSKNGKRTALLRLIMSGSVSDDLAAAKKLYNRVPDSAYSHLKSRLINAIFSILFPEPFSCADGEAFGIRYRCRRDILIGQFFIHRQALEIAKKTLLAAKVDALEANLILEAIDIEDLLIQHFSTYKTNVSAEGVSMDLETHIQMLRNNLEVKKLYLEMARTVRFYKVKPQQLATNLEAIEALKPLPQENNIFPEVKYWRLRANILYNRVGHATDSAMGSALGLLELIQNKNVVLSGTLKFDGLLDIAKLYMYDESPLQCDQLVLRVRRLAHPDSLAYLEALELAFLRRFYMEDFEYADRILCMAMHHAKLRIFPFLLQKWSFYQANLEFVRGNHRKSMDLLAGITEFMKYKSKWLLGYKLLEMYNLISLSEFDLMEYKLHALKQLLKRQREYDTDRCKFICKVLSTFVRNSYDVVKTYRAFNDDLFIAWEPFNYEVVNLDIWLKHAITSTAPGKLYSA